MESKPSRIPRRVPTQPLNSRSTRTGAGGGGTGFTDLYCTRETSLRQEPACQASRRLYGTSTEWETGEREAYESPWKLPTSSPTRYSGTLDRPWSGRLLGNRNRLNATSSSLAQSWFGESERTQGAYSSRLQNQQQDRISKRPKLSYTSTSGVRSNGLNTVSDSPWRYNDMPRSSSMVLGSLGTELVRERRDLERTDSSIGSLVDYSHRSGDFPSSSYLQERSVSYAQGARPKDNSLSSLRLNTSMNRQLPSEHQSSLLSRDHSWSSRSNYVPREVETLERNIQPEFTHSVLRSRSGSSSSSERTTQPQRSLSEPPGDTEGRRTTRQLLSRLASSMSSTFFSRRSSQDSFNSRQLGSEESTGSRSLSSNQASAANTAATSEGTEAQSPDVSQGFSFLRRRWGLSGVSPNPSSDSEAESFRHESESRNAGSWLSSSLRNRCTPLFSRRRREGRDETARTSTSETAARSLHLFRRRESGGGASAEAQSSSLRPAARPPASAVQNSATSASLSDSGHGRRNSGLSGIFPGSLLRFAVPPTLGNNLSDNVMITVDIIPSSWNQSEGQDNDKSKLPPSRDPERLQKIKESLLSEDSEEEEGDLCRICQMSSTSPTNPLIEPCKCTGSLRYVHQECMKKWLQSKINSGSSLEAVTTCELCKEKLHLKFDDFDIHELHRAHANEQADYEFISSGLYLVVLLHLCEQRFSDMLGTTSEANTRVRFINLARTLQAHMDDIETASDDDSEDGDLGRTLDAA